MIENGCRACGCRACGSRDTGPRFPGTELPINICRDCGALYRTAPDQLHPDQLYNREYFLDTWHGSLGRFFHDFDPEKHKKTRFFNDQLAHFEGITGGPGKLLDVGCANGVFVWMAEQRGWHAEGVEISPFAARWGKDQFQVHIHEGTITDIPPGSQYDVITLWDTIEHLPDPERVIRECCARLAPGGILAVLTPDAHSLVSRMVNAAYHLAPKRSGDLLHKLYHQDHLTYFDRHSLSYLLIKNGYSIQWMDDYDEDPKDTETAGVMRAGVFAVHLLAALMNKRHELLVWARKAED